MSLLIFAIALLIVVALVVYAIGLLLQDPFNRIIQAVVILVAAVMLADRANLL